MNPSEKKLTHLWPDAHNPLETSKSIRITPKPHEIAVNAIKMVPHINKHLLLTVTGNKVCNFES